MQKFFNHFNEHYVLAVVAGGHRFLTCNNRKYIINAGDLVLFNPLDNLACEQEDNMGLDGRCKK